LAEGDEVRIGDLTVEAIETPGHTPEHMSYLVFGETPVAPLAVLTGGSLILGSAGRTDLLGAELAMDLTRAQYHSLRRLTLLPDETRVLPTHGAGSFCASSAMSREVTSTMGVQRRTNPALLIADEEQFISERLSGLPPYPAYYTRMAPINRAGADVLGQLPTFVSLAAGTLEQMIADGCWVVDGRDRISFAAGHVPGSLNVELDDAFARYVGWVVPFGAPLAVVLPEPVQPAVVEAMSQLVRIGYEHVAGYLAGGIDVWRSSGRPVRAYPAADMAELSRHNGDVRVLDVRHSGELAAGRIPGSLHAFVGDLAGQLALLPCDRPVWTVCASGRRASLAASLLDRAGIPVTAVTSGGVPDWLAQHS
jgi:hydroxyacylglutathione hydrolase